MLGFTLFKRLIFLIIPALLLTACQADLYTKLSESEANEIVALLLRNGVSASRVAAKDGTSTVRVEETSFANAVALLKEAGLPRPKFATMGEVFADTKLVSSPTEERARFIYAVSQELSKTLSEIDGVITARVHLVLPRNDPLREDNKPSSASVFIKHDAAVSIAPLLPQIKTLVTNSIEGLTYEKVSVVFVPSERGQKTAEIVDGAKSALSGSFLLWFNTLEGQVSAALILLLTLFTTLFYFRLRKREGSSDSFSLMLNRNLGIGSSDKTDLS